MKRFTVPCDFNGVKHPFHVYIGEPHPKKHPLQFQAWWLSSERGGTIPQDVMDSFEKLFKIAQENNVSFEDLCVYALGTAQEENAQAQSAPPPAPPADDAYGGGSDAYAAPQAYEPEPAYAPPAAAALEEVPMPQSFDDAPQGAAPAGHYDPSRDDPIPPPA